MSKKNKKPDKQTKRFLRVLRTVFVSVLVLILFFLVFMVSYIAGLENWQKLDTAVLEHMDQTLLVYDNEGTLCAGVHGKVNRIDISISQVPDYVQKAFISAEDMRFYEHGGIDVVRILGALWEDIKSGSLKEGASTITQQLVKLTHLSNEKTFSRKLQEALLAVKLESMYTKDQILEMYLNYVYFGHGAYGIEAASMVYFNKSASELTLDEGALLAGILKSPTNYAPHLHPEAAVKRRNLVLSLMQKYGYITSEQRKAASEKKLTLAPEADTLPSQGYFVNYAVDEACKLLNMDNDDFMVSGYKIYTTLDSKMQQLAEEAMADDALFPQNANDGTKVQGAIVVLDARTGAVAAMVGGRDRESAGLNRAVSMQRQPGSAIKPVMVYAPALESGGYCTTTLLKDEPTTFGNYSPSNFGNKYNGTVTFREALARSLNVPAVTILDDIGVETGKSFASTVGIPFSENDGDLSLALGGFYTGVSPLELCGAYQPFANSGKYSKPSCITKIVDAEGNVLYQNETAAHQVMDAGNAFLLTDMLHSAVEWGTATRLNIQGVPLACKTGTTDYNHGTGNTDAWAVAYNPDYITCAWMGFDKTDAAHHLSVTGGSGPVKLLQRVFSEAYQGGGPWFTQPDNVVKVTLDAQTLHLAYSPSDTHDTVEEYFIRGTEPKTTLFPFFSPVTPGESPSPSPGASYGPAPTETSGNAYEPYQMPDASLSPEPTATSEQTPLHSESLN
ncbi:MAG: transglycosylase domain-containing protein [Bacillota bacterium]